MSMSNREMVLAWVTIVALLCGAAYLVAEPRMEELQAKILDREAINLRINEFEKLIAQHDETELKLDEMLGQLPQHPRDVDVTSQLLKELARTAQKHGVTLLRSEPDEEKKLGNLYEVAINCRWEGSLDALVHFLYDLQSQGAIFDIRKISVQPIKESSEKLKGNFVVDCAYSRTA